MLRGIITGIKVQEVIGAGSTQGLAAPINMGPSGVASALCSTDGANVAVVLPAAIAPRVVYLASSAGNVSVFPASSDEIFLGGALGPDAAYTMNESTGALLYCLADGLWWGVATG